MRIKIGNNWYEAEPGHPMMVEFTPCEKEQVTQMAPQATRLAHFVEGDPAFSTVEAKQQWMDDGARVTNLPLESLYVKADVLLAHVRREFGWNGGMGDPPDEDTIMAIIRGYRSFVGGARG